MKIMSSYFCRNDLFNIQKRWHRNQKNMQNQGSRKLIKVGGQALSVLPFKFASSNCPLGKKCNLNDIFHAKKGTLLPEKGHFGKLQNNYKIKLY